MLGSTAMLLSLIAPLFVQAITLCSFSDSPFLGTWELRNTSVQMYGENTLCPSVKVKLTCRENNSLELQWSYQCNKLFRSIFGEKKKFFVEAEKLPGHDGYWNAEEFYWDGLIPGKSGAKIELALKDKSLLVKISEDPKSWDPEILVNDFAVKIPEQEIGLKSLIPPGAFHGTWKGTAQKIGSSKICHISNHEIRHENNLMWENHFYLPDCDINIRAGGYFFRENELWGYPENHGQFSRRGTITSNTIHWEKEFGKFLYREYLIREEIIKYTENSLRFELKTETTSYLIDLSR